MRAAQQQRCSKCDGRKFVHKDDHWIRCKCLRDSKRIDKYAEARVPSTYHSLQWHKLFHEFSKRTNKSEAPGIERAKALADRLSKGQRARSILLYGHRTASISAGYLILRDAIDSGFSAYCLTTSELIDTEFNREEKHIIQPAFLAEIVFLRLATEPPHTTKSRKYAVHAIEKLCLHRRTNRLFTIYSSQIMPDSLKREYGRDLKHFLHESPIPVKV